MDSKTENLKWLCENFCYIDSVTVVDNTGKIIVKKRFNPRYTDEENTIHNEWSLNKNILEVFPSLSLEDSTLLQVLSTGKIIYCENQEAWNYSGRKTVCNNITFPIISKGRIVGAAEISRDITHIENRIKTVKKDLESRMQASSAAKYTLEDIITQDEEMLRIKDTIAKVANSSSSVLVYGETGTGKELIVSSLHNAGYRKKKPFIPVNCAALPESILEGLLFGSRKGAFTGAENRKGLFEEAHGGTIYLDEINSMPLNLQAKLLRVLQEKAVMPLGESKPVAVDVRIAASTNKSPEELLSAGELRSDLLYRLNTISINLPPLRDRPDDIPMLIRYFLDKYNLNFGKNITGLSKEAEMFLANYNWMGNVRELEHAVEGAMNVANDDGVLTLEYLPAYLTMREPSAMIRDGSSRKTLSLAEALETYEKRLISEALNSCGGKVVDAAAVLKVPRTTLQYKVEKYKLKK